MPSLALLLSPLLGAIMVGVIAAAMGLFGQNEARSFARFVFSVAMPIAVFNFMRNNPPPDWSYAGLIAGYVIALFIVTTLLFFAARKISGTTIREAGAIIFAGTCGNAVFLGLPIALSIPNWGSPFLILMIFEGFFAFAIGPVLMTWPEGDSQANNSSIIKTVRMAAIRVAQNPIVIGNLLGVAFAFSGWSLPEIIAAPINLFSGIASPFGLFVLGIYLTILPRGQTSIPAKLLSYVLPVKLVLFPALTAGLVYMFSSSPLFAVVAGFFAAMPPAVASMLMASTYQQYEKEIAAIVGIGTVIGIASTIAYLAFLT